MDVTDFRQFCGYMAGIIWNLCRWIFEMSLEQDYRVLARFLVKTHGDDALDYVRRFMEDSSDGDAETEKMWLSVGRAVEQVIAVNARRRKGDQTSYC